jgi:PAS domain-containing protein
MGSKLFLAPVRHPALVQLAERYIQVVLAGLRRALQITPDAICQWDEYLEQVVHSPNSRVIRLQGYTPVQLLFGYSPRYSNSLILPDDSVQQDVITDQIATVGIDSGELETRNYFNRLANLDEHRERAIQIKIETAAKARRKSALPRASPREGDLVLLRRLAIATQHGRKLKPRWEGLYRLFGCRFMDIQGGCIHGIRKERLEDST